MARIGAKIDHKPIEPLHKLAKTVVPEAFASENDQQSSACSHKEKKQEGSLFAQAQKASRLPHDGLGNPMRGSRGQGCSGEEGSTRSCESEPIQVSNWKKEKKWITRCSFQSPSLSS